MPIRMLKEVALLRVKMVKCKKSQCNYHKLKQRVFNKLNGKMEEVLKKH